MNHDPRPGGGGRSGAEDAGRLHPALGLLDAEGRKSFPILSPQGIEVKMIRAVGFFMRVLGAGAAAALLAAPQVVSAQEKPTMEEAREAINAGNIPDLKALLKGGLDPNSIDKDGMSLVTYAVSADKDEVLVALLAGGANPNTDGGLALALAALSDNMEAVQALVDKGADVNAQAGLYRSAPIHWACKNGNLEMVAFLLSRGAHLNVVNDGGWTPLVAASTKNPDVARLLLSKGAPVDQRDGYGYTPLMYAAKGANLEMIEVLLNAGANPNLQSPVGETAADLAVKSKSNEAIKMLSPEKGKAPLKEQAPTGTPAPPGPRSGP
jgi:ankyrin repeat protein